MNVIAVFAMIFIVFEKKALTYQRPKLNLVFAAYVN